jgi:hypothetical protein
MFACLINLIGSPHQKKRPRKFWRTT